MQSNSLGFTSYSLCKKGNQIFVSNTDRKLATVISKAIRISRTIIKTSDRSLFTQIDHNIYIGAAPVTDYDLVQLKMLKVYAVISLVQSHEPHIFPENYGAKSILRIPTPDYYSPTTEQLYDAIEFAERNKHVKLFIHCRKGKGRSAVCSALIMAHKHKISLRDSYDRINALRSISSFNSYQWMVAKKIDVTLNA